MAQLEARAVARFGDGVRVVNASVSGETTAGGLSRLPRALRVHAPDVVVLELGGNDGLRGTPLAAVRENLAAMIRLAQDAGARVVLVGIQIPRNYGPDYADAFAALYPSLANAFDDVALVPFLLDGVALEPSLMQADGIHATAQAQPRLLDNVWPVLAPVLEAALADAAPAPGP